MANLCVPETFSPVLPGIEILNIAATVLSANDTVPTPVPETPFCNVTVTYTRNDRDEYISVESWLPLDNWNGRFQGVGGGGFSPGRPSISLSFMVDAVTQGFAAAMTDAGLIGNDAFSASWALSSPGVVDIDALENFGYSTLGDQAAIGKAVVESFYGQTPSYSYFNGCSGGGRHGLMVAQRYPTAYDAILANAPAIYPNGLFTSIYWPYQVMLNQRAAPHECEVDAITAAAVAACDKLDGIEDGIITNVDECLATFNPFELIGTMTECSNGTMAITSAAASLVNQTWNGPVAADGEQLWYGFTPGTDLTGNNVAVSGGIEMSVQTNCSSGECIPIPQLLGETWYQAFLIRDYNADLTTVSHSEFSELFRYGRRYDSIITSNNPDLSEFKRAGGKMITAHGNIDQLIPYQGTESYYEAVMDFDTDAHDYYRYFHVPGFAHCSGGVEPSNLFNQLMDWAENGIEPDSTPVQVTLPDGEIHDRIVCPYPQKAVLSGCEDAANAECWKCSSCQAN